MRVAVTSLNIAILVIIAFFIGRIDIVSYVIFVLTCCLVYSAAKDIHQRNRKALQVIAEKGSWLENFFKKEHTLFLLVLALLSSLVLSLALTVIFKGITINHGYVAPLAVVFAVSYFIIFGISKITIRREETQLAEPVHHYTVGLIVILIAAFVTNILLALLLSSKDTMTFLTANVDFSNFEQYAYQRSIDSNGVNEKSRVFINLYLLLDAFKIAVANQFTELFIGSDSVEKGSSYYLFFAVIFLFNMIKLLPFSIALTMIVIGAHQKMNSLACWLGPRILKCYQRFLTWIKALNTSSKSLLGRASKEISNTGEQ